MWISSCSLQLKEHGQLGAHGVLVQQHVILDLGLVTEVILVVSHVLAAHLILEIVTVSLSKLEEESTQILIIFSYSPPSLAHKKFLDNSFHFS